MCLNALVLEAATPAVIVTIPEQIVNVTEFVTTVDAMRLLRKEGKNGTFNPLEQLVEKIKKLRSRSGTLNYN